MEVNFSKTKYEHFNGIWEKVDSVYPLFEERKVNWLNIKNKYMPQIAYLNSYEELYELINNMLFELHDPHTKILNNSTKAEKMCVFPLQIISFDEEFFISNVMTQDLKALIGKKIITINGLSIDVLKAKVLKKYGFISNSMIKITLINDVLSGIYGATLYISVTDGKLKYTKTLKKINLMSLIDLNTTINHDRLNNINLCLTKTIENNIGYIRIMTFNNSKVVKDFYQALEVCSKYSSIILDIRGNMGGLIEVTKSIASSLISKKIIIGYKVSRKEGGLHNEFNELIPLEIIPNNSIKVNFKNMIILCDDFTASSAEFVFLRAMRSIDDIQIQVVGNRTAGLAHQATIYTLNDGTRLQITTSKYLSVEGKVIREVGISPDIYKYNSINLVTKGEDEQLNYAIELCNRLS